MAFRRADLAVPAATAICVHAIFFVGLLGDRPPEWLGMAWPVSAALVGLGVALVIFLLQAAGQGVGSQQSYRALVGATGLVWPAVLALTFVLTVGVVERFGGTSEAPSWANTTALAAFAVQVLTFGVAFSRTLRVVGPSGVAAVIEQAFRDTLHMMSVENSLRRFWMRNDMV